MELEIGADLRAALDKIEAARISSGASQAELARAAGLSESAYNKLVNNPARTPFRRTVLKLRDAMTKLEGAAL